MRYLLLLLIFWLSFGILDSVPRFRAPHMLMAIGAATSSSTDDPASLLHYTSERTALPPHLIHRTRKVSAPLKARTSIAVRAPEGPAVRGADVSARSVTADLAGSRLATTTDPAGSRLSTTTNLAESRASTTTDHTVEAPSPEESAIIAAAAPVEARLSLAVPIAPPPVAQTASPTVSSTAPPAVVSIAPPSVIRAPSSALTTTAVSEPMQTPESTQAPETTSAITARTPAPMHDESYSMLQIHTADPNLPAANIFLALPASALPNACVLRPLSARDMAQAARMADSIRNSLMNPRGVQFIGEAGVNWSGASSRNSAGNVSGRPLAGFTLGVSADIPLKKQWSFRPKAEYAFEGFQPDINGNRVDIHVAYIRTPLDIVYHTDFVQRRFFVGAGPYLAYGATGTYTFKGIGTDMRFGSNVNNGDNLRKMDYGADLMAGLLLDRNFVLGAQFDLGLSDISPAGASSTIHTRSFGLSLLYVFRN